MVVFGLWVGGVIGGFHCLFRGFLLSVPLPLSFIVYHCLCRSDCYVLRFRSLIAARWLFRSSGALSLSFVSLDITFGTSYLARHGRILFACFFGWAFGSCLLSDRS